MNEKEILEYNKRCALFLGAIYSKQAEAWGFGNAKNIGSKMFHGVMYHNVIQAERFEKELKFHSDWNWIMEVVEAIEKLKTETSTFEFHTQPKSVLIKEERNYSFEKGDGGRTSQPLKLNGSVWITGKTKKEAVVEAINQFLIWYNNENS